MRAITFIISALVLLFSCEQTSATIRNVFPGASIQDSINVCIDGDTVLVHPATYVENINFDGHDIVLGSLFLTTGDTSYISATIIDGDSSGPVIICGGYQDTTIYLTITGFTIQNGYTNLMPLAGGINCFGPAKPIIDHNIITYNNGVYVGGIYFSSSNAVITNNIISNNSGFRQSGALAGGIGIMQGAYLISGNIICGNYSTYAGGGIGIGIGSFDIINNTIYGNSADSVAGGMFIITQPGFGEVVNNISWENSAPVYKEIYNVYEHADISYCNVQDTLWPGVGNISCCPEFCNALGGDFHLALSSCCVGAGNGGVDIGALGAGCDSFVAVCDYVVGDVNGDNNYNGLDVIYGVNYFKNGPPPVHECECTVCNIWYASGDVNGSCSYNGLDITYGVNYFKGGPDPIPCADCPPIR